MKKWIVKYDAGYGDKYEEVECETEEEATYHAYELWKQEAESNAEYSVVGEYTEDLAEEYL